MGVSWQFPTSFILPLWFLLRWPLNGFRVASLKDFNLEPLVHGGMFCHGRHSQKAISFRKRLIWKGNLHKGRDRFRSETLLVGRNEWELHKQHIWPDICLNNFILRSMRSCDKYDWTLSVMCIYLTIELFYWFYRSNNNLMIVWIWCCGWNNNAHPHYPTFVKKSSSRQHSPQRKIKHSIKSRLFMFKLGKVNKEKDSIT